MLFSVCRLYENTALNAYFSLSSLFDLLLLGL